MASQDDGEVAMELGEVAHQAWRDHLPQSGQELFAPWASLSERAKDAWRAAARAVEKQVRRCQ